MENPVGRLLALISVISLATLSVVGTVLAEEDDSDGDGLPDSWEIEYFGDLSHGPDEDFDGDGYTNLEEYEAGTDPTDINDKPRPPANDIL